MLQDPSGDVVVRDISEGVWAEPSGDADSTLGDGMWALPGLVDAHGHLSTPEFQLRPGDLEGGKVRAREALAAGVTLVLDKGWADHTTMQIIDQLALDERPDIEAAGRLIAVPDGYLPGFTREVGPTDSLEEVVREEAAAGRGWVKLVGDWPRRGMGPVANFDEGELARAVRVASELGASVAIHTMAREVPSMAVAAGVRSIEHGLFLAADDLALLGDRQGMWVPTLLRVEAVITQLGSGSSGGKLLSEGLANTGRLLNDAVDAGVHVLAGTDLIGSSAEVAAEALKLIEHGLTPQRAIDAVSGSGLRATGRSARFDVAAPADAVLFPANPLEEPGVLAHPSMVIRHGRVL
jgi:imidazolonepropionase-like amidohydrolase